MGFDPPLVEDGMQGGDGSKRISCVAEVLMIQERVPMALCRTAVHRQMFMLKAQVTPEARTVTLWNAKLSQKGKLAELEVDEDTIVLQKGGVTLQRLANLGSACAGIDAVGVGLEAAGLSTKIRNEVNERFCRWLEVAMQEGRISESQVVSGSIGDNEVVSKFLQVDSDLGVMAAGIACQPYSRLGDRREGSDERSKTLPFVLRAAFAAQCPIVILECVKEAMVSDFVQHQIGKFMQVTGYQCKQKVLELHKTWPTRRTRWWCILSHPAVPIGDIPPMPEMPFELQACHLTDCLGKWDKITQRQLELDHVEISAFEMVPGGLYANTVDPHKPMQTALHSWGSQAKPCECGCRPTGFAPQRIQEKGIYGALVPTGGQTVTPQGTFPTMRHLHPQEVALYNGLDPAHLASRPSQVHLRLELAGVGQLASPLQAAWVVANALQTARSELRDKDKEEDSPRQVLWKLCKKLFEARDRLRGHAKGKTPEMQAFEQAVDTTLGGIKREDQDKEEEQKTKRQKIQQVPTLSTGVPGFEVREATTPNGAARAIPAVPPREEQEVQPKTRSVIPVQPVPTVPWPCGAGLPTACAEGIDQPRPESAPSAGEWREWVSSGTANHARPASEETETRESRAEVPVQATQQEEVTQLEDPIEDYVVAAEAWVSINDGELTAIRFTGGQTVGQLTVAESKLNAMQQPVVPTSLIGVPYRLQEEIYPNMQVCLHDGGTYCQNKCPRQGSQDRAALSSFQEAVREGHFKTRQEVLMHQRMWVADDEMEYYLKQLAKKAAHSIKSTRPLILHEAEDPRETFRDWLGDLLDQAADQNITYLAAFLDQGHWSPLRVQLRGEGSHSECHVDTSAEAARKIQELADASLGREARLTSTGHPVPSRLWVPSNPMAQMRSRRPTGKAHGCRGSQ